MTQNDFMVLLECNSEDVVKDINPIGTNGLEEIRNQLYRRLSCYIPVSIDLDINVQRLPYEIDIQCKLIGWDYETLYGYRVLLFNSCSICDALNMDCDHEAIN